MITRQDEFIRKLIREELDKLERNTTIAYHVTNQVFDNFKLEKIGTNHPKDKHGFFFTDSEWNVNYMINNYRKLKEKSIYVYTCKLSFKNPYTIDDLKQHPESQFMNIGGSGMDGWNIFDRFTESIISDVLSKKRDSIVFKDFIVILNPENIKILKIQKIKDKELFSKP
jgi:hypothetical protein